MSTIHVKIAGVTPLIMNRFTEENEVKVSSGTSKVSIGQKKTPREEALSKTYIDNDGYMYVPGRNVFACLIEAGKFHKMRNCKLTTQKSSIIPAGIFIPDLVCSLNTKDFEVDSRSVVIPKTGGRIMAHRPRFDKWELCFTLEIDDEMFSEDIVRKIVDDAGKKIGLGDFRPDRKGPFGRFVVTEWTREKAA